MKRLVAFYVLMMFLVFTLPVLIINLFKSKDIEQVGSGGLTVKAYDCKAERTSSIDLEDYIVGVVAAEMPANFHIEALKAQALAARTYTLIRLKEYGGSGCDKYDGADICTDSTHCQAYRNPNELSKKDREKIIDAVMSTQGEVIVYEDNLIDAVFHSTSGGKTENSEDVWVSELPYLRSVLSEYEDNSPKLVSMKEISIDEFCQGLEYIDNDFLIEKNDLKNKMRILKRSEGGRIQEIEIGNKVFSGRAIREQFGLNSSNFDFEIGKKQIVFTVIGYGHGIGMSQYGADGMAQEGYDYKDIIRHYYSETEIVNIIDFR